MKYIIGNWKSNLSTNDIKVWFKVFAGEYRNKKIENLNNLELIICAPYVYLPLVNELISQYQLPIKPGAQNLSPYANGAFTGEVSAAMLSEFVKYVIIGHSERKSKFGEDEKMLSEKAKRAYEAGLKPIYCISDEQAMVPNEVEIIAYEPVWAIGTGKSDTPENAGKVAQIVKQNREKCVFIYGGSVNADNVNGFLNNKEIDGVLPGKASLDPTVFWEMIKNASTTV